MSFHTATVDLRLGADGELLVQWTEAPGQVRRPVRAAQMHKLLACMQAVHDAEQTQVAARMQAAWLAASHGLVELLDGPERALFRRVEETEQQGQALLVAVRALADHHDALRGHPATRMLWQLLPLADLQERGRSRLVAVLQLGPQVLEKPQALPHGGLRILCMAFSPQDVEPVLDYEGEEERFLEMLAPFVREGRAQVRIVEDGTLEELERALLVDTYDILHLTGHGLMSPQGPRLVMEDETGMRRRKADGSADVSPAELIAVLRRGASIPPIVVLSNCHSAASGDATPSFAVELVAAGVPVVLGWTRPVRDDHATDAAGDLYQQLAAGKPLVEAVEFARSVLRQREQDSPQPSRTWVTLALVAHAAVGFRVNRQAPPLTVVDARETYKFLAGGQMKVLVRGFVGRRRPLQRLVRVLRDGRFANRDGAEAQDVAGVTVWGMKGMGKSCLVARAVERVRQQTPGLGMVVLHGALDDLVVLDAFRQLAIDQWGDLEAEKVLEQKDLSILQRIRRVLVLWRTRPVALILDDFEQNLEARSDGPARLRAYVAELLDVLLPACKLGQPKLLITTTAIFEPSASHAAALGELRLGELEVASVRKLWMRGPSASAHIPVALGHWEALAARLGNNARILTWARDLLAGKTSEELAKVAARATAQVPTWEPGDEASPGKHDELARLFLCHMAHDDARSAVGVDAKAFLGRARVYETAVPAEAFEGLTEGLSLDLDRDLVVLANLGLLEVGELGGQRAYRVSPLIEPQFTAEQPELWHDVAARYWWSVTQATRRELGGFDYIKRTWLHSLSGRNIELAEKTARLIHHMLRHTGYYHECLHYAEEHLEAFPDSVYGLLWAGDAEALALGPTMRALGFLETGLRRRIEILGTEKDSDVAAALYAIGGLRLAQGDHRSARDAYESAIAIQVEVYGAENNPAVVASYHALGSALQAAGQISKARTTLEHALTLHEGLGRGGDQQDLSATLHALGTVLWAQGDLPGARDVVEQSLRIKDELHGIGAHPGDAASLQVLGGILHAQGELVGAREVLELALEVHVGVYGGTAHPNFALTLGILGRVLLDQGDIQGARDTLEEVLTLQAQAHGTDVHPDIARSLLTLGRILRMQRKLLDARSVLERSLAIYESIHGTDKHPAIVAALETLAAVLAEQGDLSGAHKALERCIAIEVEVYNDAGRLPDFSILNNLARLCLAEGKEHESVGFFRRSLAVQKQRFGTLDELSSAETEAELAWVLFQLGKTKEANTLKDHALPLLIASDPDHPCVGLLDEIAP